MYIFTYTNAKAYDFLKRNIENTHTQTHTHTKMRTLYVVYIYQGRFDHKDNVDFSTWAAPIFP